MSVCISMEHRAVVVRTYTCDQCGRVADPGIHECCMCGRDLCDRCFCYAGADGATFCRACWERGAMYRAEIDCFSLEQAQVYRAWKHACTEARTAEEAAAEKAKENGDG